jgi:hypothetical protein
MSSSDGFDHSLNAVAIFYFLKLFTEKVIKGNSSSFVLKVAQNAVMFRAGWMNEKLLNCPFVSSFESVSKKRQAFLDESPPTLHNRNISC